MRKKVDEDVDEIPINNLCTRTRTGIDVLFFGINHKFFEMIMQSLAIQTSRIFNDLWRSYSKKLREVATMELIFTNVWQTTREQLKTIKEQFLNGQMELTSVDVYLKMFKYDYEELQKDFALLFSNSNDTARSMNTRDLLGKRIQQVQDYQNLFNAGQAARAILKLKEDLGLEGDFEEVEHINEVQ